MHQFLLDLFVKTDKTSVAQVRVINAVHAGLAKIHRMHMLLLEQNTIAVQ
jgi:hypothetical protein